MTDRVLLVDFENVQAVDLGTLPADVTVLFVLGAKQSKLPTQLAMQAQALGERFKYVPISGQAANAVDFCIAFHLGEHLARDPKAECVILSKDKKGFDPLVKHLVSERGFKVRRVNAQKEAFPVSKETAAASRLVDPYARVVGLLAKEQHRPLRRKGLEGKLNSYLPAASAEARGALLERLFQDRKVAEVDGTLRYEL
jgi:hypothetical protein